MINYKDIIMSDIILNSKKSLGMIYKSKLNGNDICCRLLNFDRLSRYDLEAFSKDIDEI